MKHERVLVGISGGVDSAVTAALLMREGYEVIGGFIRTWHPDFIQCTEEQDRLEAMRVAAHLGIPMITIDAREAYKKEVADVMIREYGRGRTPNPDMLCNKVVKFGVMDDARKQVGARFVATGHYAQVRHYGDTHSLHRGIDPTKDQSYFLANIERDALARALFPIGAMTKAEVRARARSLGLPNAHRKDSQGICFLGAIDMRTFLERYLSLEKGSVVDRAGNTIGEHDGVQLYTLGERHGLRITDPVARATPLYVVEKHLATNTLVVDKEQPRYSADDRIALSSWHHLAEEIPDGTYDAVLRYHGAPTPCRLVTVGATRVITLEAATERPSAGQTCVLYTGDCVVASAIIETE